MDGKLHGERVRNSPNVEVLGQIWVHGECHQAWLNSKTGESYRLPSEAEWEYAVRAGSTTIVQLGEQHRQQPGELLS